MSFNKTTNNYHHGDIAISIIGGKWKFKILTLLIGGPKRFNELQRLLEDISPRTLFTQLKSLESYQIIVRKEFYQVPPKVEYSISKIGESLIPALDVLTQWGKKYSESVNRT
ncbi:MAG: winged helix-turn-helix transcriptional regulator [Thermodesulfobacteriota bacterium]